MLVRIDVDELVEERLARHVAHPVVGVVLPDVVADGLQEVGLAQAGVAVDEQGVVGPPGRLGHRQRGGVGEPVRRPDDEGVEGELRLVQPISPVGARRARRLRLAVGDGRVGRAEQLVERISASAGPRGDWVRTWMASSTSGRRCRATTPCTSDR